MKCCQPLDIRKKCTKQASLEGKEVRNTIVLTFAFQVVFTGFNALQNLHSSLHDEEGLGNIALAIISGTAILSSIFSPTIIGLIGAKSAIVAYFAAHCIYVLANFYPSFATMAPAAVALGAFQGPAWTSQALYISASAFSFSKSSSASPYSILSRFNGFFFAVFATSQIVGNLVTSTVIKDGVGNSTDDSVIYRYCGPDDCPSSENATTIEDPEDWVIDITLGFFMACELLGLLMVIFFLSPLPRSEWIQRVSVRSTATSCFNVLMSTNMVLLVPFIFFTAVENAFLLSAFTKSYVACPIGIHMVGYVMAVYGATTPVFVFLFSRLSRIAGRFILLTVSLTTHMILFIILFEWSPTPDDEVVIFIIPAVWGVSESILQAQANSLIAMLFPTQKEPAFANFHAWRSLGYAITFLNASYMCVSTKLIVCMAFAGIGMVLYIVVEFKTKVKERLALNRPRKSIVSVQSEIELKGEIVRASVSSNRTSVSSLQSVQDRLSFDRFELTDIITEAQQGWKRDEDGLTLEVKKVMSVEHLARSKVTNWYHNIPVLSDFNNKVMLRQSAKAPGLPRSLSDGHLHYAAVKVDAALVQMRRGRSHTINNVTNSSTNAIPIPKRRHVSDINPPNFHVIHEIVYEEDEFSMENETEIDSYISHSSSKDDNDTVFEEEDDDVIGEEEVKRIMDYRNVIRRLSETLKKDSLALSYSLRKDIDDGSLHDRSSSSDTQDIQTDQAEYIDQEEDGGIMFTGGSTLPSSRDRHNSALESDDGDNATNFEKNYPYTNSHRLVRSISSDNANVRYKHSVIDSVHDSSKHKSVTETSNAKKKGRLFSKFKGFRRSKSTSNDDLDISNNTNEHEGREHDDNSDADSDGFVKYEQDDNDNYLNNDIDDIENVKRKGKIPISEREDVNSIY